MDDKKRRSKTEAKGTNVDYDKVSRPCDEIGRSVKIGAPFIAAFLEVNDPQYTFKMALLCWLS